MISESDKYLIRRSWDALAQDATTVGALFYQRLFTLKPDYKALFKNDLKRQERKLLDMLGFVVQALDWPAEQWPASVSEEEDMFLVLQQLGWRHHALYQIPESSYDVVGECLLWTLKTGLGDVFTPDVEGAWSHVYELLVTTMRLGAETSWIDAGSECSPSPNSGSHDGRPAATSAMMVGRLKRVDAKGVLRAVSLSRQFFSIEFHTRERVVGWVFLKSGMVLGVELRGNTLAGLPALYALIAEPLESFKVYRLAPPAVFPEPVGHLKAAQLGPTRFDLSTPESDPM